MIARRINNIFIKIYQRFLINTKRFRIWFYLLDRCSFQSFRSLHVVCKLSIKLEFAENLQFFFKFLQIEPREDILNIIEHLTIWKQNPNQGLYSFWFFSETYFSNVDFANFLGRHASLSYVLKLSDIYFSNFYDFSSKVTNYITK